MASSDTSAARLEALHDFSPEMKPYSSFAPTPGRTAPPSTPPRYPSPADSGMEPPSPMASIPNYAAPLEPPYHSTQYYDQSIVNHNLFQPNFLDSAGVLNHNSSSDDEAYLSDTLGEEEDIYAAQPVQELLDAQPLGRGMPFPPSRIRGPPIPWEPRRRSLPTATAAPDEETYAAEPDEETKIPHRRFKEPVRYSGEECTSAFLEDDGYLGINPQGIKGIELARTVARHAEREPSSEAQRVETRRANEIPLGMLDRSGMISETLRNGLEKLRVSLGEEGSDSPRSWEPQHVGNIQSRENARNSFNKPLLADNCPLGKLWDQLASMRAYNPETERANEWEFDEGSDEEGMTEELAWSKASKFFKNTGSENYSTATTERLQEGTAAAKTSSQAPVLTFSPVMLVAEWAPSETTPVGVTQPQQDEEKEEALPFIPAYISDPFEQAQLPSWGTPDPAEERWPFQEDLNERLQKHMDILPNAGARSKVHGCGRIFLFWSLSYTIDHMMCDHPEWYNEQADELSREIYGDGTPSLALCIPSWGTHRWAPSLEESRYSRTYHYPNIFGSIPEDPAPGQTVNEDTRVGEETEPFDSDGDTLVGSEPEPESESDTLVEENFEENSEAGDFYDVESESGYEDSEDEDPSESESESDDDDFVVVSLNNGVAEEEEEQVLLVDANERTILTAWNGRVRRGSVYPRPED